MGRLRSRLNATGEVVNDVVLGQPTVVGPDGEQPLPGDNIADLFFAWDDSALPNGELVDGEIVPDEPTLP